MRVGVSVVLCFFFFKQKTAYEMRISDWSSDVCSSDLGHDVLGDELIEEEETLMRGAKVRKPLLIAAPVVVLIVALFVYLHGGRYETTEIGRASCRERVCQ